MHGATGSAYIFLNVCGEIHGYSLTTGLRILKSHEPPNSSNQKFLSNPENTVTHNVSHMALVNLDFLGSILGTTHLEICESAQLTVSNFAGFMYLVLYSAPQVGMRPKTVSKFAERSILLCSCLKRDNEQSSKDNKRFYSRVLFVQLQDRNTSGSRLKMWHQFSQR